PLQSNPPLLPPGAAEPQSTPAAPKLSSNSPSPFGIKLPIVPLVFNQGCIRVSTRRMRAAAPVGEAAPRGPDPGGIPCIVAPGQPLRTFFEANAPLPRFTTGVGR